MPTNQSIDLSIIIPAKNEADRMAKSLEELASFLKSRQYDAVEIVVVTYPNDPTALAARTKAHLFSHFKVVILAHDHGKGGAVRVGMFEAGGKYKLFMDADLATPLTHLDDVYNLMQNHVDVAIAVRDLWRIHKGLLRKTVTKSLNLAIQILLVPGIKDTQCGFKLFSSHAADEIFARQTLLRWSFDVEILKIARLLGYQIEYIEAPDWKDPKAVGLVGESIIKIALAEFKDPFVVLLKAIGGKYKHKTYHFEHSREVAI